MEPLMSEPIPGPAYCIITPRLLLRCWNPSDAEMLNQSVAESQEHLKPWMPWARGELPSLQERLGWLRRCRGEFDLSKDFVYAIFNPEETRVLGGTGLHTRLGSGAREIGYWIHKDFINQGFATEASAALTKAAFEIEQVNRVEIHCDPKNVRSAAVPRKLGYTFEAVLKQRIELEPGTWRDSMIWTLTADQYPSSPSASVQIEAFDAAGRQIIPR
jgi:RimJ/RimL family protein N-acetyltransferase